MEVNYTILILNQPQQNIKLTWTARNEDFFCLRWGVPSFVTGTYFKQASDMRVAILSAQKLIYLLKIILQKTALILPWKYAFERQWLFYKIWGRLLYNPHQHR